MSLQPGDRLGSYEIIGALGAGGMGAVFRARDTKLNRQVAIKVLPAAWAQDRDRMARFQREAQVLAALNHPHIAAIYGLEENALILELVEGDDLKGPLPVQTALEYARQIAEALEYAHEKGIVHRDLKPANVKVTPDAQVKVLDFGLAKMAESSAAPADPGSSPTLTLRATEAGMIMGTASYMAPEQARGQSVDRRADVWAFGVVLAELLTGRTWFAGETVSDTLAAVLRQEPDLDKLPAETPPAIRNLIRRCLEKDRRKRLQSIGDARIEIEECLSRPLMPEARAPATTPAPAAPSARFPWIAAASFALLAATVSLIHFRESPPAAVRSRFAISAPEGASIINSAISPDGRTLAFTTTDSAGHNVIALRAVDSLSTQFLPGTEDVIYGLFWSPDSRSIAFFDGNRLKKMEVNGGAPIVICDIDGRAGIWSRHGQIVLATPQGMYQVSEQGGECQRIGGADTVWQESWWHPGDFLPDGRHYLFTITGQRDRAGIFVGTLGSKDRVRVLPDASTARYAQTPAGGYLLFWRNGSMLAQPFDAGGMRVSGTPVALASQVGFLAQFGLCRFTVSDTGVLTYAPASRPLYQLTWLNRDGKRLGTLGEPNAVEDMIFQFQPRLSPDGKYAAVDLLDVKTRTTDLWLIDVARNVSSRFTFDTGDEGRPVWSPDGAAIAFDHRGNTSLVRQMFVKPVGHAGKEELVLQAEGVTLVPMDWSRDGRYLLFLRNEKKTRNDLWVMPNPLGSGDHTPIPFAQSEFNENDGAFSPDGKWIAYNSDESGRNQVYLQPFPPTGAKWQISKDGGNYPRWRGDGRELFFISNADKMMAVDIKLGATVEAGNPAPLFQTRIPTRTRFDVTGDGQRFLLADPAGAAGNPAAPVIVTVNWWSGIRP